MKNLINVTPVISYRDSIMYYYVYGSVADRLYITLNATKTEPSVSKRRVNLALSLGLIALVLNVAATNNIYGYGLGFFILVIVFLILRYLRIINTTMLSWSVEAMYEIADAVSAGKSL